MISVNCNDRKAWLDESETLTAGGLGQKVEFNFSDDWDGLQKYAVFVAYDKSITIPMTQDEAAIPPDVLALPGICLFVGVYGTNLAGTTIIPTKYCNLGMIHPAANPAASDNYEEPTASMMAQMLALTKAAQLAASIAMGSAIIGDPTDEDGPAFSIQDHKKLILTVPVENDDPVVIDIGTVTAYGAACEETGYSETYDQFKAKMAAAYSYDSRLTTIESALDALDDRLSEVEEAIDEGGGSGGGDDPEPTPEYTKVYLTGYLQPYQQTKQILDERILSTSTLTLFPKQNATSAEKANYTAAHLNLQSQANGSVLVVAFNPQAAPVYFQILVKTPTASS